MRASWLVPCVCVRASWVRAPAASVSIMCAWVPACLPAACVRWPADSVCMSRVTLNTCDSWGVGVWAHKAPSTFRSSSPRLVRRSSPLLCLFSPSLATNQPTSQTTRSLSSQVWGGGSLSGSWWLAILVTNDSCTRSGSLVSVRDYWWIILLFKPL